jgi:hypothetical protein
MNWDMVGALGEIAGASAVVVSLIYLARQVAMSNRLARAEAYRLPNSDLNALNTAFGLDPIFSAAFSRALEGATREEFSPEERSRIDWYLISVTNIYEQLSREVREGILGDSGYEFGGTILFGLPFYRSSWPIYRPALGSSFVDDFERRYGLDPSVEVVL